MEFVYAPKAQQRLWLADQLTPESAVYLGNFFLRLRGQLDIGGLEAALGAIVARHEVLRTSLSEHDGEVVGVLRSAGKFRLDVADVDPRDLDRVLRTEAASPVDVAAGPPIRLRLLRLGAAEHILCLGIHHVASDRGSRQVLYDELGAFYSRLTGSPEPEPEPAPLAAQFRTIAAEQDARHDVGELAALIETQRAVLSDREAFELLPDLPRPAIRTGAGATYDADDLPAETLHRLTALGRERAASLYMVLLAACQTVLYRYTGRPDVTTGTSASTREDDLSAALIGPFFGMLVLPGDVSGNPAFADLVTRVRDVALDAYESRTVPFDTLVAELGIVRDPGRTPLFQILVDLVPPTRLPSLPGIEVTDILTPGSGAKYDLTIEFRAQETLGFSVEYDSALYEPATIERLMRHLRAVLLAVADDPRVRVEDVPMLGADEIAELRALAEPARSPLTGLCLHELFARQATATPDAVAVRDGGTTWTYAELDWRATAIASGLAALGVGPDVPVGVLLERSPELLAVLFGILKAGGAYVPVDPESPRPQIGAALDRSGAPVCLIPSGYLQAADIRRAAAEAGCLALSVDEVVRDTARPAGRPPVHPDNLCSIYFTSGSTGEPKGVASTHRGWVGQLANLQQRYQLSGDQTMLWKTPLTFDDVAREIFWPLMLGATVAVLPPGRHRDPRALLEGAIRYQVPWLQFVPGMLAPFLDEIRPDHLSGLTALRDVVSDGDRLPPATVAAFAERLGRPLGTRLHNHWGTTEVSIDSTHHVCTEADATSAREAVTLGQPMENHEVHVLGPGLSMAPLGGIGELAIGGVGLARGYLGDPGRTARAFVPHPFRTGERLYRTGDTGRWGPDGELIYCGRRDHQVKVRGVRVELGEVETAARSFAAVSDAAALWEPAPGDRRIVLYAACAVPPGSEAEVRAALLERLSERLVPQAVPGALMLMDQLPRNPSGKVDRRALPPPDVGSLTGRLFVPPATDAEAVVAEIWAEVLGRSRLGADDDFFAAGGHSLLVTRAVNRMRQSFAVDISVRLVFEHSTVRAAAARVEDLVLAAVEALSDAEAERLAADSVV